jgi:hypothetical protein
MSPKTGVIIFEGGLDPRTLLAEVRRWTTLDTTEKFLGRPDVDTVILATDQPDLAREAEALGAAVHRTGPDFHFGQTLQSLVSEQALRRVVFLGGGSVPLLRTDEADLLLEWVGRGGRRFVANNAQSPDIIGLGSTEAVASLASLRTDNATLFALTDSGHERLLLPETATVSFDLDTPSDVVFLAHEVSRLARRRPAAGAADRRGAGASGLGPRTTAGLAAVRLDLSTLERAADVLRRPDYLPVSLVGRVSGPIISYLNANLRVRLRVFSEERGMKALGRLDEGKVRSLLGFVLEDLGAEYLVERLDGISDAIFWDTRVLMGHLGLWPDEADRFEADLGRWERVRDPVLARLCRAAGQAKHPFVLGGHSVVAGGLRLLVEGLLEDFQSMELYPGRGG